ncbi:uncharacterized protein SPAPADRAFT_130664 [Spathaspora passalidarum NRRL Y-27907]|uniref:Uncharacterized protein n=1 Tax=Spathaspora passalidarum (strain NRRL Y-27907 / 11-Y1) TaxID=619300 RepID=G3AF82_SPAPN|nr:uncharacterized protein SPAPADRAFT_130664 [Spathaspora passalidarum NRRL Y-27907]EGW34871.1 hypothetical protein SPAPADRAFT_130664 [Spathaspora passalidarum NRRL Y-27907]
MSDRERKKLALRIRTLFDRLYKVEDNGFLIYQTFQTLPLRTGTDYYKLVKNPLSLHAVGKKIKTQKYASAQEFIDDLALISWNARYFNEPGSAVYRHAQILKEYISNVVLPKLRNDKAIPNHSSLFYPNLGDLPDDNDDPTLAGVNFGDAGESTPRREEFVSEMSVTPQADPFISMSKPLVSTSHPKQQPFINSNIHTPKHQTPSYTRERATKQAESGIRRGRPPIIDKPFETRIKLILKGFKKLRDATNDHALTKHFERLPDIKQEIDYYERIPNPISLQEIKVKVRSRKYATVDQFINDLDLMFANAQTYYGDDPYSEEFMDYQQFKKEAQIIIQMELSKSDKEVLSLSTASSDGVLRFPMDSLEVNGYTYKIGDWVLMSNPVDAEKPTVGQIFRLWSTEEGNRYCNICWYYRPEQTCHAIDRLFFKNEVCKTGQYRDHLVDEIVGPCYVIFLTRYQKGDLPEGVIPDGAPWFICEFRYNESTHVFNRIRTWKACLPDEVRDDPEQPLIPLHENRKLIKYESPLKNLLRPDAYVGMPIPDPIGGQPNTPPVSGSVYKLAPIPDDDLGQYISSPNVTPMPEHDDVATGRRAFLFTPISQLKGGGGATTAVYATSPSVLARGSPTASQDVVPTHTTTSISAPTNFVEDKHALPGSYKSLQAQIQESQAKKLQEQQLQQMQLQQHQSLFRRANTPTPTSIAPTGGNYHTSASTYSTLLAGGTLAYGLNTGVFDLGEEVEELVNKRQKLNNEGEVESEEFVFYRAPPVLLSGRKIITNSQAELGHSAAYLAWKLRREQQ